MMNRNRNHPAKKSRDGFTLIEVLVVLFILSIVLGTIVFSLNTDAVKDYQAQNFTKKLLSELQLASIEAITRQQFYRFVVHSQSYQFEQYNPQRGNESPNWIPLTKNTILRRTSIPAHISLLIEQNAQIYIYPSGELSSFQIAVIASEKSIGTIFGDASGHLAMEWTHEK